MSQLLHLKFYSSGSESVCTNGIKIDGINLKTNLFTASQRNQSEHKAIYEGFSEHILSIIQMEKKMKMTP
jgi:hypothetical protein